MNFAHLGLKKLIATYYDPENPVYRWEYEGGDEMNIEVGTRAQLRCDGDFRSEECIAILKECDMVVSNPPFSLLRKYVAQLVQYEKKFLILGNQNAIVSKELFPLLKNNRVWIGQSIHGGDMEFEVPDFYEVRSKSLRTQDGHKYIRVPGVRWFTNLDVQYRHEPLSLPRRYADDPGKYPRYDDFDAINVDRVCDIPGDYGGVMGVPISFLNKYCPEQFEILGCTADPESSSIKKLPRSELARELIKAGKIKGSKCVGGHSNVVIGTDGHVHVKYHRILISLFYQNRRKCRYEHRFCWSSTDGRRYSS